MREMTSVQLSLFGDAEVHLPVSFLDERRDLERRLGVSVRLNRTEKHGVTLWSGDVVPARPLALLSDPDPVQLLKDLETIARETITQLALKEELCRTTPYSPPSSLSTSSLSSTAST